MLSREKLDMFSCRLVFLYCRRQLSALCSQVSSSILPQQFIPFAVIGSDHTVVVGGKKTLGRQTKWGFIEIENKRHCEFAHLRDMLIR